MKTKLIISVLGVFALSSCGLRTNHTQDSTLSLCYRVMNQDFLAAGSQPVLDELARRGEDCSGFTHLRGGSPDIQDIEVNVQQ